MKKAPLMISISGIRGIFGESFTPDVIVKYGSAFSKYCKGRKVVIGRDGRITGKIVGNILASTLLSMGSDVIALGIAPTPTIALAVERFGAAGGVSITASHNPLEWNGLKFINNNGMFLNKEENEILWQIADSSDFKYVSWKNIGRHLKEETFYKKHIEEVLSLPLIQPDLIKSRRFRVVVDCINASGSIIVPQLLKEFGCEVVEINTELTGIFSHTPEPVPENLGQLCSRVREIGADFGIAVDPDADRLVFVTEKGEPLGEEYTVTIAIKTVLEKEKKKNSIIVVNLSTTRGVDIIAKYFGAKVVRTPVGEINVATKMKSSHALIGGEGSGGVIFPHLHFTRDAIVGIALALQQMAEFKGTLSQLKETLPQYHILKRKIQIDPDIREIIFKKLKEHYGVYGIINEDDGLKFDFDNSWIHLRKSNTEPIIRIIAESESEKETEKLINEFENFIKQNIKMSTDY